MRVTMRQIADKFVRTPHLKLPIGWRFRYEAARVLLRLACLMVDTPGTVTRVRDEIQREKASKKKNRSPRRKEL